MARRRKASGGGALGVLVVILAMLATLPKEVWIIGGIIAAIALIAFAMSRSSKPTPVDLQAASRVRQAPPPRDSGPSERTVSVRITSGTAYKIPAPSSSDFSRAKWLLPGEPFELSGLSIRGGLVYVGLNLKAESGRQDPALINPNLKVSRDRADVTVRRMPYWPSYSDVDPIARKAYLQWLASGRRDPSVDIGYVFLFFYGLERRALVDLPAADNKNGEMNIIRQEVRELLDVYAASGSFRMYASNLLAYLAATSRLECGQTPELPNGSVRSYELPFDLKIGLAQFAVEKTPVPSTWALAWALADPAIVLRTPARRCREQFLALFPKVYQETSGAGITLPVNKTKLKVSYRPASAGFACKMFTADVGLPDVTAIVWPQKKLQAVVDACIAQLERYSRFIAKHSERAHCVEALALLPASAWPDGAKKILVEISKGLENESIVTTWEKFLKRFGNDTAISRSASALLASRLEEHSIGLVPDLIAGAKVPAQDDTIVLFASAKRDDKVMSSGSYAIASLVSDLGAMVANADGKPSASAISLLASTVNAWDQLDEHSKARLRAGLRLPGSFSASLKRRMEVLPEDARRAIAEVLASAARADELVGVEEVRLLETIYKQLQLDPKLLYSDLHGQPSSASKREISKFGLDAERIAKLQVESDQISSVLKDVFADDQSGGSAALVEENDSADSLLGLDEEHERFVRLLVSRPQWSRADLSDVAGDMELMLDGALEKINEAALTRFEMPIAEGEDPVEINSEVAAMVMA